MSFAHEQTSQNVVRGAYALVSARPSDMPGKGLQTRSSANGGQLPFLALATCFCKDLYCEAAKRGVRVEQVQVEVQGDFGAEGEPARNVLYRAHVKPHASPDESRALLQAADRAAEIQNTLRTATPVALVDMEADAV